jgi:Rod binding domain-containing protein
MFEIMFKEVKLNPLGEDSGANKIYKSLMVEKIAGKVSEVSQLGIADLVLDTLLRNQEVK